MSSQGHTSTRPAVLRRYVQAALDAGVITREGFTDTVRVRYEQSVPEPLRTIRFQDPHAAAKPSTALNSNMKTLFGWWDPERTARFPAEIEEAVVLSLPEPFCSDCIRELAGRYGLYGAFRRPASARGDADAWAAVLQDFAQVTQDMADILADKRMDEHDAGRLPELREHIRRMAGDLESLDRQAERVEQAAKLRSVS